MNAIARLRSVISRFGSVSSALSDAVVVLREHLEIDWVNRAAQALLGRHPRDAGAANRQCAV